MRGELIRLSNKPTLRATMHKRADDELMKHPARNLARWATAHVETTKADVREGIKMVVFERRITRSCRAAVLEIAFIVLIVVSVVPSRLRADEVTDWNQIMVQTVLNGQTSPVVSTRMAAIVEVAVFDAVNGIERRYTPIHVDFAAPAGASKRAAAIQAAYATLVVLYPAQKTALDADLQASLAGIASDSAAEDSQSIARGVQWGQTVANDIMAWRSTDGFTPAPPRFVGGLAIGEWRPTPPDFSPGAVPQFAHMTPWVINSPNQFRTAGPPALTSDRYTAVFDEVKMMGIAFGSPRTADQTELALFWNGNPARLWNGVARAISAEHHLTLSDNAHLFGLLSVAMADAAIACWDGKYYYIFWRPITAIVLADLDGNPATIADPAWIPLLQTVPPGITPNFPEYPSGHATVSAAAAGILAAIFGDNTPFTTDSEKLTGVLRSFPSFSQSVLEVDDARVFGGIHFRNSCLDGNVIGQNVADFVLQNGAQSLHGQRVGQISHDHGTGTVGGDGENAEEGNI
jgi:membrane-associated phospholipid phosphatase